MSSQAQVAANRQNAQLSTGPATPEGKAKSSLNAVKTGLTGRTVLLPSEDAAAYQTHVARFLARYDPANDNERALVQSLADTEWRLLRIPSLEMGIHALGRLELASNFQEVEDPEARAALIEAKIYLTYQRQLNNLSIQEGRLRKQREQDLAALKEMQTVRCQQHERDLRDAAELYVKAQEEKLRFDPAELGFEISIQQIKERIALGKYRDQGYSPSISARFARCVTRSAA